MPGTASRPCTSSCTTGTCWSWWRRSTDRDTRNVSIRVGSRISIVNTGSGHIFLAFATPEERKLMLEHEEVAKYKLAPELSSRLERVRENGYEIMPSLQIASVTNLSVPIFGPLGGVVAALTVRSRNDLTGEKPGDASRACGSGRRGPSDFAAPAEIAASPNSCLERRARNDDDCSVLLETLIAHVHRPQTKGRPVVGVGKAASPNFSAA